jgi:hypothetical protein
MSNDKAASQLFFIDSILANTQEAVNRVRRELDDIKNVSWDWRNQICYASAGSHVKGKPQRTLIRVVS